MQHIDAYHMLATCPCVLLPMLQPQRARTASCPCPTPPLPCACRGRRSRTVSPSVAQCRSRRVHAQRLHAWHWRPADWLAGWRTLGRWGSGGGVQARRAAALLQPTQHNTHPASAAQAAPEPASTSCGAQPGTPLGGASPHRGRRGNSSSSEEGAHTVDEQHGTGMPLLGAKTDRSALPGLRQRRGHQEGG